MHVIVSHHRVMSSLCFNPSSPFCAQLEMFRGKSFGFYLQAMSVCWATPCTILSPNWDVWWNFFIIPRYSLLSFSPAPYANAPGEPNRMTSQVGPSPTNKIIVKVAWPPMCLSCHYPCLPFFSSPNILLGYSF